MTAASTAPSISWSAIGSLRAFADLSLSPLLMCYSSVSDNTVKIITSLDSLAIVDFSPLSANNPAESDISALAQWLFDVFATTGFAYFINAPLSFDHGDVCGGMAKEFFDLPEEEKMKSAKRTFGKTEQQHLQRACRSCHALTRVVEVEMEVEVGA